MTTTNVGAVGGICAIPGLLLLLRLYRSGVHNGWLIVAAAGYAAVIGLLLALARRSSTTVTDEGVVVRHTWRTTAYRWSEIADIRFEQVSPPAARITIHGATLYDARRRRVVLPYLNDRNVAATARATAQLRNRWVAGRDR